MQGINLTTLVDGPQGIAARGLSFSVDACAPHRHRLSSCKTCVEACPAGAIERGEQLTIDPERCLECGACAAACPVGAIEVMAPSNSELLWRVRKRLSNGQPIAFACGQCTVPESNGGGYISLPCLGRLDESVLAGAAALGASTIWLVHGDCDGCTLAPARARLAQVSANTAALSACFGANVCVELVCALPPEVDGHSPPQTAGSSLSRRRLLKLLSGQDHESEWWSVEPAAPAPVQSGRSKGVARARPSTKQHLLVESARRLGEPLPGARLPATLSAHFGVNAACSGCQMCALFCPTGALSKVRKGEQAGVAFQASLCTNCGLCREICYWKAVELTPGCDAATWVNEAVEVIWFVPGQAPAPW